ncbi:hypothetical protein CL614_02455 [archaeon]|nr:hypothetical protein [archaeon]
MAWIKSTIRPFFGLLMIQPVVILWLWLFSDNIWDDYFNTGWVLQTMITIYLIPIYHYYELFYEKMINGQKIV